MTADQFLVRVKGISKKMSIMNAEQAFISQGVNILPVVDNNKLAGVITKNDLFRALPSHAVTLSKWEINFLLDDIKVEELIKKPLTVTPQMNLMDIVDLALEKRAYNFPVVERGNFMGMIYEDRIIKFLLEETKKPSVKVEVNFRGNEPRKFSFLKFLGIGGVL